MDNEFTHKINEEEMKFQVRKPTVKDLRESRKIYNIAFKDALDSGCMLKAKLDDAIEQQELWGSDKKRRYEEIQEELRRQEELLKRGNIKLTEAREIATKMRDNRQELMDMISETVSLSENTAEGQANDAKFNYLIARCLYVEDKLFFKSYDELLDSTDNDLVQKAGNILMHQFYPIISSNWQSVLPENQFLEKYGEIPEEEPPPPIETLPFLDDEGNPIG